MRWRMTRKTLRSRPLWPLKWRGEEKGEEEISTRGNWQRVVFKGIRYRGQTVQVTAEWGAKRLYSVIYLFFHSFTPTCIGHFQWTYATYSRVLEMNEWVLDFNSVWCGGVKLVVMVSNSIKVIPLKDVLFQCQHFWESRSWSHWKKWWGDQEKQGESELHLEGGFAWENSLPGHLQSPAHLHFCQHTTVTLGNLLSFPPYLYFHWRIVSHVWYYFPENNIEGDVSSL